MVKIIGYYVVFSGKPDTRRASVKLNVDSALVAMDEWGKGNKVWIKGNGYQNWEIAAFEKIVGSELDIQRALRDGLPVVTEDELKQKLQKLKNETVLPPGEVKESLLP